jgi:hypothetical protein
VTAGYTYTTNVRLTNYDTWTTGQAVSEGAIQYDPGDNRDYYAPLAISSGDNSIRPSLAVLSSTESIAARWSVVSNANAWAPFDTEIYTRLVGYDATDAVEDPVTFTFTCTTPDIADTLILAGLINVEEVTAAVTYSGSLQETLNAELTPSSTHYGHMPGSCIINLETPIAAGTAVSVAVTLDAYATAIPLQIGVIALAREFTLAETEWGVETRILSFSKKERDETFGTVKFLKRGSATQLSATCYYEPGVISGDTVMSLLAQYDGQPILMDFNNSTSDYDRLRIFGFYTDVRSGIPALSWETLNMNVESLVK